MVSPYPQESTLTRSEYLRLRADTPPNGNGDTPAAHVCRACGTPLTGPAKKVWCSDKCRGRGRNRNRNPARRTPKGTRPPRPAAPATGVVRTPVQHRGQDPNVNGSSGHTSGTNAPPLLPDLRRASPIPPAGLLELLAGAGVTVTATLSWGGRSWTLTPGDFQ